MPWWVDGPRSVGTRWPIWGASVTPLRAHPARRGGSARGFAFDLDRTLVAVDRAPSRLARATIQEARSMGLSVILVSGRTLSALSPFVSALGPLEAVVAENGAVIEVPWGGRREVIGGGVAQQVRSRLEPISALEVEHGEVVVSGRWTDRRTIAGYLSGLDIHIVRNRDRLMVLPTGVTKASGLELALRHLRIPEHSFAAIGDGENDIPMLRAAAVSGAVANAIPVVKALVDYVAHEPFERGVQEFLQGPVTRWASVDPSGRRSASRS